MSTAPARLARFLDPDGRLTLGRVQGDVLQPVRGDLFAVLRPFGTPLSLSQVTLLAPVRPATIVVVHPDGRLCLKPATAVIGPGEPVRLLGGLASIEAHACTAAVIGRTLVPETSEVAAHVLGETILCDVVAPDQAMLLGGGGYDTFCPLGPWIRRGISAALLSAVARVAGILTLYPGDVVAVRTGEVTIAGAGECIKIAHEGLGILENPVKTRSGR
ncbi:MAG: 2-keto-4-pentenoate hydratase/2-oxohepta-3-ene-1,7-dioic acid hydratase in catechol pathway [Myxococcota bacterium]|jgi:2-keto-4-pentenoate hydratase/2-oxohepta-3-ene-1,7-dioic acid hydratase in catechol pathway